MPVVRRAGADLAAVRIDHRSLPQRREDRDAQRLPGLVREAVRARLALREAGTRRPVRARARPRACGASACRRRRSSHSSLLRGSGTARALAGRRLVERAADQLRAERRAAPTSPVRVARLASSGSPGSPSSRLKTARSRLAVEVVEVRLGPVHQLTRCPSVRLQPARTPTLPLSGIHAHLGVGRRSRT